MIKYDQLISGGKDSDGDCFRACIATVLQLPIETLPNWHDNMWFLKWDNWLHERGLGITVHSFYYGVDGYWIASVKSQNYKDTTHAVVMNDEKLFHDPSPVKKFKSISDDDILASYHIGLTNIDKLIQTEIAEAERRAVLKELKAIWNETQHDILPVGLEPVEYTASVVLRRIKQLTEIEVSGGED